MSQQHVYRTVYIKNDGYVDVRKFGSNPTIRYNAGWESISHHLAIDNLYAIKIAFTPNPKISSGMTWTPISVGLNFGTNLPLAQDFSLAHWNGVQMCLSGPQVYLQQNEIGYRGRLLEMLIDYFDGDAKQVQKHLKIASNKGDGFGAYINGVLNPATKNNPLFVF